MIDLGSEEPRGF